MAQFVAKKVAKHVMKETAGNKYGTEDPYFEHVSAMDMNGNTTGMATKRKRAIPPGLTKKEEKVLKKVTRRAYRLDNAFNFCGIRIGWGAIVGIIPALGDVFDSLMALMVFRTCTQADLPAALKSRMVMNIVLDFVVGLIPILGDVADALFRANTKNAALLHQHLKERGAARIVSSEKVSGASQPLHEPATASTSRPVNAHPSSHTIHSPGVNAVPSSGTRHDPPPYDSVARLQQAKVSREGGSRGWLGRFASGSGNANQRDLENGELADLQPRR